MKLPALLVHADWSVDARKRWCASATLQQDARYLATAARLVGPLQSLLKRLDAEVGKGPILLGFDFPIGLPRAYAKRRGIADFTAALQGFDNRFYDVATQSSEISPERPFYPYHRGGRSKQHLIKGLGLTWCELLRRCDRKSATRREACALFWTLGGQQVGKAAIAGWRDLLAPALRDGVDLALWPFHGRLDGLLASHRFVVAETYPAEFYHHLGLNLKGGKGDQQVRRNNATRLCEWAKGEGVDLESCLVKQIEDGFGADKRGDDRFDAVIGLFGMLNVVLGRRASGEPDDDSVRRVEGWILGQDAG